MTWLAFMFALELGYNPMGMTEAYQVNRVDMAGDFYAQMQGEIVAWDLVFIGGDVRTYAKKWLSSVSFFPNTVEYAVGVGVRYSIFELGFRHICIHPVTPLPYHMSGKVIWEAAYEEIYLRIEVGG